MKMCQDIIDFAELLIKYEKSSKLIPINFGKLIKRTNVSIPKVFFFFLFFIYIFSKTCVFDPITFLNNAGL